jgi:hypothetical protein
VVTKVSVSGGLVGRATGSLGIGLADGECACVAKHIEPLESPTGTTAGGEHEESAEAAKAVGESATSERGGSLDVGCDTIDNIDLGKNESDAAVGAAAGGEAADVPGGLAGGGGGGGVAAGVAGGTAAAVECEATGGSIQEESTSTPDTGGLAGALLEAGRRRGPQTEAQARRLSSKWAQLQERAERAQTDGDVDAHWWEELERTREEFHMMLASKGDNSQSKQNRAARRARGARQ